jgi:hypothetical protein
MQREILRQTDVLRNFEASYATAQETPSMAYSNHLQEPGPPLSPRQMPTQDLNQRRPSIPNIYEPPRQPQQQPSPLRPPVGSHLTISPRRYGSIGSNQASYSPSSGRPPPPPPPPTGIGQPQPQHPLATVSSPPTNLPRRHTSADIRLHGWQGAPTTSTGPSASLYASGNASVQWPSSPARAPMSGGIALPGSDQALRDALASYELPRGPSSSAAAAAAQNRGTPPPPNALDPIAAVAGTGPDSAWAVPGSRYPYNKQLDVSGSNPPTRRSSMASNIHGILNPTGEHPDEDLEDGAGPGKRKRLV